MRRDRYREEKATDAGETLKNEPADVPDVQLWWLRGSEGLAADANEQSW